ncbi:MAG: hypothetical protein WBL41_00575, partial [Terracidiphilus sp.]
MKPVFIIALVIGCFAAALPQLRAQDQQNNPPAASSQSNQPAAVQQPNRTQQQSNQNPFPEDTDSVPLMPSRDNLDLPSAGETGQRIFIPSDDADPVRSPEDAGAAAEAG